MSSGLGSKIKVAGLIIILVLLLFCAWMDVQERTKKATYAEDLHEEEVKPERIIDPNKPMLALTFDDGPGKLTMQLLEQLEAYDARASFFMVGRNVPRYPEAVKKMSELGCDIGNHSVNHPKLTELETDSIEEEINGTNVEIQNIIGQGASMFRPPYGEADERVSTLAGAPLIMWSVDTRDWESKDVAAIRDYVLETVQDGDIVLLHDIHEATVQAAIECIPKLIENGYQLVTVSEMAAARGITLENGVKYYEFKK